MRQILIPTGACPPADWLAKAQAVEAALRAAQTEEERDALIEKHKSLWRDPRVLGWLLSLFNNKCWYSEAEESVSSYHVDHFRPKGRVTDVGRTAPEAGYWWLAFDWTNYRISGQLFNVKKSDVFPITSGHRAAADDPHSLKLEAHALIDPLTPDACLISFEMDEDACLAVTMPGADQEERRRAEITVDVIGLNRLDLLKQKRGEVWKDCREEVASYEAAAGEPPCLKRLRRAMVVSTLAKRTSYGKEFSSVSEACIRKLGSELLRTQISRASDALVRQEKLEGKPP